MEKFKKVLESKVRIQYHDCDPFNHLNNSKYIDYILAARTEQLLHEYGLNISELAIKHGIGWVVAQTQISYFNPASWMEFVTVESKLIQFSESSLLIEAIMYDENKTKIKCVMWTKFVHFDIKTQKSIKHSAELMKLFGDVHFDDDDFQIFESRIKYYKQRIEK